MLAAHPDAPIRVYAVWYRMYPGDARARWRAGLLPDRRVQHWWDEKRLTGTRLVSDIRGFEILRAPGSRAFDDDVLWDAYLLFDGQARWRAMTPRPASWGYTILAAKDALAAGVGTLVAGRSQ